MLKNVGVCKIVSSILEKSEFCVSILIFDAFLQRTCMDLEFAKTPHW